MLHYPDIDKVALHLGPLQIHWYGIMYVVGFAAGWWLARRQAARPGSTWTKDDVDDLIFWSMVGVRTEGDCSPSRSVSSSSMATPRGRAPSRFQSWISGCGTTTTPHN